MSKKKEKDPILIDLGRDKDWIKRDDDFVHRSKIRSGWEDRYSSSSDYILKGSKPDTLEKEVKEIYKMCKNRAANLSPIGSMTNITFTPEEETGKTDGKKIFIGTKVLDEKKTFQEKAEILLGVTTHELAHVRSTDFETAKRKLKNNFDKTIFNIIEDERIEREIGEEFPGYSSNIANVKKYFLEERYLLSKALAAGKTISKKEEEDDDGAMVKTASGIKIPKSLVATDEDDDDVLVSPMTSEDRKAIELTDLLFKMVRYPKNIDADMYERNEAEIEELGEMLKDYPETSKDAIDRSIKIARYIREKVEDEESDKGSGEESLEMVSEMMDELESNSDPASEPKDGEVSESTVDYDYSEEWIEDKDYKAIFRKAEPNESNYKRLLDEVKGDAARLANVLHIKTFNENKKLYGMQNGTLDDNRIVEAVHGIKTVHTLSIPKVSRKVNVTLLIDESGSMAGSKANDAAKVGVLIEEAFRLFPAGQLFIYGFTSDHRGDFNTIYRYKEPGLDVKFGLGDVRGRSNNRDGHCIRAVTKRVRTFTQEPMLYFIISDGYPAGESYGGSGAIKDTREAVLEAKRKNFFPIQIGISVNESEQAKMFDEYINYTSSREMVDGIRKLLLQQAHKFTGI